MFAEFYDFAFACSLSVVGVAVSSLCSISWFFPWTRFTIFLIYLLFLCTIYPCAISFCMLAVVCCFSDCRLFRLGGVLLTHVVGVFSSLELLCG
jgi:hypothetical protein